VVFRTDLAPSTSLRPRRTFSLTRPRNHLADYRGEPVQPEAIFISPATAMA
jgi:hypothetical protein